MSGDLFEIGPIKMSDVDVAMNNFADRIVDGFTNLLDRLQLIAETVSFNLPAMATGSIMPYGVGMGGGGYGGQDDIVTRIGNVVYESVTAAMENQSSGGQHVAVLEVNGREFCRATYYDQQAVAKEHGVSLITNG